MNTVSKICKKMILEEPFYGFFLSGLYKKFSTSINTAGVFQNGLNFGLDINEDYWKSLTDKEKYAVLKHELLHLAFFHLFIRPKFPDKILANIAFDIEVNCYIQNLPEDCITYQSYPDLNLTPKKGSAVYYEKLKQNLDSGNPNRDLQDFYNKQKSLGRNSNSQSQVGSGQLHEDWDESEKNLEKEGSAEVKKELLKKQLESQLKDIAKNNRGCAPAELKSLIDELLKVIPEIFNWKAYFRRFLGYSFKTYTKSTKRRESLRIDDNPRIKLKKKQNILVAIDTSGSVSNEELLEFFSEIYHIWKTGVQVTIVECDATITDKYDYKGKFRGYCTGRGGTCFNPVIDFYNKNANLYTTLIYFTDGYGESNIQKPFKNMMWVVTSNGKKDKNYFPGYMIQIPNARKN